MMKRSTPMRERTICPCCGATERRVKVREGDVWQSKHTNASGFRGPAVRIVSPEKDGAIVEQVGREDIDGRFGMSYRELAAAFHRKERS